MSQPQISIVIPAWNAADTLPATLDSVFAQDHPSFEVIVVDDGSTDDTPAVLAAEIERRGERLRGERIPNSGGPARPRNVGVEAARGELVALFDSDDLMEPGKLSAQAAVFDAAPDVGLCFTDFAVIDARGELLESSMLAEYRSFRDHLEPVPDDITPPASRMSGPPLHTALLYANFVGTSSVVARRELLREAGGFDTDLSNGDDVDMWMKLARTGTVFAFLDIVGHRYRRMPGGVTARGWRRLPAVAEIRARQRPFVDDPVVLRHIDETIRACKLGEGWGRRHDGDWDRAEAAYRGALSLGWSLRGQAGLWLTQVLRRLRG